MLMLNDVAAGGSFSSLPSDWQGGCIGIFLWIIAGEPPRLLLLRVHLQSQKVWRDTTTVLYVMGGIVWFPWRRALPDEKELVLYLGTSYFYIGISLGFPLGLWTVA